MKLNKSERGSILFVVITFIFVTGLLFLLILKVYIGSLNVIKEEKTNQTTFNNTLKPNNKLLDNIKIFPDNTKKHLDFNKIFKDAKECKGKSSNTSTNDDFSFVSSRFCSLSKFDSNIYKGNITTSSNIKLESPYFFVTGSILINGTLLLTNNITYIYSLGDVKINNFLGEDPSVTYFVFLDSASNKIEASSSQNVQIANDTQNIAALIFPTYTQNVLYIR